MALEGPRRRSPPLGVGAVEPVQEVEGAEVLVELEVVKVVVLARLEEGQVVAGVLDQCVDHHVGVPGNLGDCDGRGSSNHNQASISLLSIDTFYLCIQDVLTDVKYLNHDMTLEEHRRNSNGCEVGHDVLDRMGIACIRVEYHKSIIWHCTG